MNVCSSSSSSSSSKVNDDNDTMSGTARSAPFSFDDFRRNLDADRGSDDATRRTTLALGNRRAKQDEYRDVAAELGVLPDTLRHHSPSTLASGLRNGNTPRAERSNIAPADTRLPWQRAYTTLNDASSNGGENTTSGADSMSNLRDWRFPLGVQPAYSGYRKLLTLDNDVSFVSRDAIPKTPVTGVNNLRMHPNRFEKRHVENLEYNNEWSRYEMDVMHHNRHKYLGADGRPLINGGMMWVPIKHNDHRIEQDYDVGDAYVQVREPKRIYSPPVMQIGQRVVTDLGSHHTSSYTPELRPIQIRKARVPYYANGPQYPPSARPVVAGQDPVPQGGSRASNFSLYRPDPFVRLHRPRIFGQRGNIQDLTQALPEQPSIPRAAPTPAVAPYAQVYTDAAAAAPAATPRAHRWGFSGAAAHHTTTTTTTTVGAGMVVSVVPTPPTGALSSSPSSSSAVGRVPAIDRRPWRRPSPIVTDGKRWTQPNPLSRTTQHDPTLTTPISSDVSASDDPDDYPPWSLSERDAIDRTRRALVSLNNSEMTVGNANQTILNNRNHTRNVLLDIQHPRRRAPDLYTQVQFGMPVKAVGPRDGSASGGVDLNGYLQRLRKREGDVPYVAGPWHVSNDNARSTASVVDELVPSRYEAWAVKKNTNHMDNELSGSVFPVARTRIVRPEHSEPGLVWLRYKRGQPVTLGRIDADISKTKVLLNPYLTDYEKMCFVSSMEHADTVRASEDAQMQRFMGGRDDPLAGTVGTVASRRDAGDVDDVSVSQLNGARFWPRLN